MLRRGRARHRRLRPPGDAGRLPERGAQDQGHLELVAVLVAEFDAAFSEFQSAVGVDAQKAACTKIETILNEDVPVGLPYFYNYLAGNSNQFTGVFSSALGQMSFSTTSKVG